MQSVGIKTYLIPFKCKPLWSYIWKIWIGFGWYLVQVDENLQYMQNVKEYLYSFETKCNLYLDEQNGKSALLAGIQNRSRLAFAYKA